MAQAQALVPLKDLVRAKTRLAGLLGPSERRALAQAMVEDVLSVLGAHPDISGITLVSDDPGAPLLASKYGATYWSEQSLGCSGLNAVIECASKRLLASTDDPLLVLHGDLPLLETADISAVLEVLEQHGSLVIGSDSAGTGTNLLGFSKSSVVPFRFGSNSCQAHQQEARKAGVRADILQRSGIAVDVDEAMDLQELMEKLNSRPKSNTFALLCGTDLGARVELALATLHGKQSVEPVSDAENDSNEGMAS
ncbi:MAG: 2-phospho-L-lactate guanylyltransferase [Halioglobus sp.]|jgi:2-phospho-L-lactate guanylyltransferase